MFTGFSYSQEYQRVDDIINTYPDSFSSLNKFAEKISADFTDDIDKTRAIFTWMALHIKYDLKLYNSIKENNTVAFSYTSEEDKLLKLQKFRYDLANKTLKTKKGVCENYTALFQTLCELMNIKCMAITGSSKTHPEDIGKLPKASDHVWNAVKIENSWRLVDVTWAAGHVNNQTGKFVPVFNDSYFFTNPEVFFLNHFPDDKRMTMLPKSEEDFAKLPLYYPEYLKSGYEIVMPQDGIVSLTESNAISFKIIDLLPNQKVYYVFSNDNIPKQAVVGNYGNLSEFEIPISKKNYGYVTIYINTKSIASYKIVR